MPRLTNQHFLTTCGRLGRLWQHVPHAFAYLSPAEQWLLHDYFQPSRNLADAELLAHREAISRDRPSLPQQAGRALSKLDNAAVAWAMRQQGTTAKTGSTKPQGAQRITVRSTVEPVIDAEALVRVLLDIAEHLDDVPEQSYVEDLLTGEHIPLSPD